MVGAPSQSEIGIESPGSLPKNHSVPGSTSVEIESVGTLEKVLSASSQADIGVESVGTLPKDMTGPSQQAMSTCLELDSEMVDLSSNLSQEERPPSSVGKMRPKKRRSKSGSQKRRLSQKESSVGSPLPSLAALDVSSEMQVTFPANGGGQIVKEHVSNCWLSETPISKSSQSAVDRDSMNALAEDVTVPSQIAITACSRNEVEVQTADTLFEAVGAPPQSVNGIASAGALPKLGSTTSHTAVEIESIGTREDSVSTPSMAVIKIDSAATIEKVVTARSQSVIEIVSAGTSQEGLAVLSKTAIEIASVGTLEKVLSASSQADIGVESVGTLPKDMTGPSQHAMSTCLELDSEMVDLSSNLSQGERPPSSVGKMRPKKRRSKSGSQKRRLSQKESSVGSPLPSLAALDSSSEMQVTFPANGVGQIVKEHVSNCWLSETPISKSSQAAVDVDSMNALAEDVTVPSQIAITACSRNEVEVQTADTLSKAVGAPPQSVNGITSAGALPQVGSMTSHTAVEIESIGTLEDFVSTPSEAVIETESAATLETVFTAPSQSAIEIVSAGTSQEGLTVPSKTSIEIASVGTLEKVLSASSQADIGVESVGTLPKDMTGPSQHAMSTCLELDSEMVDLSSNLSQEERPPSSVGKMRPKKKRSKSGSQKRRLSQKESSVGSPLPSLAALDGSSEMQVIFPANGGGQIVKQHVSYCWLSETPISKSSQAAVDVDSMNAFSEDVTVPSQIAISACSRNEIEVQTADTLSEAMGAPPQSVTGIASAGALPKVGGTTSYTAVEIESIGTREESVSTPSMPVIEIESAATLEKVVTAPSQSAIEIVSAGTSQEGLTVPSKTSIEIASVGTLEKVLSALSQADIGVESVGTLPKDMTGPSQHAMSTCLELDSEMVDLSSNLSQEERPPSSVGKMRPKKRRSKSGSQKRRLSQNESSVGSPLPSLAALDSSSEMQVTFPANGVGQVVKEHVSNCWLSETPISKSSQAAVDVDSMNALAEDVTVPSQIAITACSRNEVEVQTADTLSEAVGAPPQSVNGTASAGALANVGSTTSHTAVEIESIGTREDSVSTPSMAVIETESAATLNEVVTAPSQSAIEIVSAGTSQEGLSVPSKTAIEIALVGTLEKVLSASSQADIGVESVGTLPKDKTGPSQHAMSTCLELDSEMVDLSSNLSQEERPPSSVGKMRPKKRRSKSGSQKRRLSLKESSVGSPLPSLAALDSSSEMQVTFPANGVGQVVKEHVSNCWLSETPISKSSQAAVDVDSMNALAEDVTVPSQIAITACSRNEGEVQTADTLSEAVGAPPQSVNGTASAGALANVGSTTSHTAVEIESIGTREDSVSTPSMAVIETEAAATLEKVVTAPSQSAIEIVSASTSQEGLTVPSKTAIEIASVGTLEKVLSASSQADIVVESVGTLPKDMTGPSQHAMSTCLELDSEMVDLSSNLSQEERPPSSVGKMRPKKRRSKSGSQKRRLSQKESSVGSPVPSLAALDSSSEMQVTFPANGVGQVVKEHVSNCWLSETPISKSSQAAVDVDSMNALAEDVTVPSQIAITACSRNEVEVQTADTLSGAVGTPPESVNRIASAGALSNVGSTTSHTAVEIESIGTREDSVSTPSVAVIEIESAATLEKVVTAPSQSAIEIVSAGTSQEGLSVPSKTAIEIASVGTLEKVLSTSSQADIGVESVGTLPKDMTGPSQHAMSTCLELDSEMVDLSSNLSQEERPPSSVGKMGPKKRRSKSGSQKGRLSQKESSVGSPVPSLAALDSSSEIQVTFPANGVGQIVKEHVSNCWLSETPISKSSQAAVDVDSMNALAEDVTVPSQIAITACSRNEVEVQTADTLSEAVGAPPQSVNEIASAGALPNVGSTTSHTALEIESIGRREDSVSTPSVAVIEIESAATLEKVVAAPSQSAIEIVSAGTSQEGLTVPSKTAIEIASVGTLEKVLSASSQAEIGVESVGTLPKDMTGPSQHAMSTCLELDSEMVDLSSNLSQEERPPSSVGKMRPKKRRSKSGSQKRRLSQKESSVGSPLPLLAALDGSSEMQVTFPANGGGQIVKEHVSNCWLSETPISKSSQAAVDVDSMNALAEDVTVPSQIAITACSRNEVEVQTADTLSEAVGAPPQSVNGIASAGAPPNVGGTTSHTAVEIESIGTREDSVSTPSVAVIEIESAATLEKVVTAPSQSAIEIVPAGISQEGLTVRSKTAIEIASVGTLEKVLSASSKADIGVESVGTLPKDMTGPSQHAMSTCLELDSEMVDLSRNLSQGERSPSSVGKMRPKKRRSKSGSLKGRLSQKESSVGSPVPSLAALDGSSEMQVTFPANGVGQVVKEHVSNCWLSETPISKSSQAAVDVDSMNALAEDVTVPFQIAITACSRNEVEVETAGSLSEAVGGLPQSLTGITSVCALQKAGSTTSHTAIEIESIGTRKECVSRSSMAAIEIDSAATFEEVVTAPSQSAIEIESAGSLQEGLTVLSKTATEIASVGPVEKVFSTLSQGKIGVESVGTLPKDMTGPSQHAISTCLELDSEMVGLSSNLSQGERPSSSVGKMRPKKRRSRSGSRKGRLSQKESSVGSPVPSLAALDGSSEMQVTFLANGVGQIVKEHVSNCWLSETPISKSSQAAVDVDSMNALAEDVTAPSQIAITACSRNEVEVQTADTLSEAVGTPPQSVNEITSVGTLPMTVSTRSHTSIEIKSVGTVKESVSTPSMAAIEIESAATLDEVFTAPSQSAIEFESAGTFQEGPIGLSRTAIESASVGIHGKVVSASSEAGIEVESVGILPNDMSGPSQHVIPTCLELDSETAGLSSNLSHGERPTSSVEKMRPKKRQSKSGSRMRSISHKESSIGSALPAPLDHSGTAAFHIGIESESAGFLARSSSPQKTVEIQPVGSMPEPFSALSQNTISTCPELDAESVDLDTKLRQGETSASSVGKTALKRSSCRSISRKSGSRKRKLSQKDSSDDIGMPSFKCLLVGFL